MKNYKNRMVFLFLFLLNSDLCALVRCQSAPVGRVEDSFKSLSTASDVNSEAWFDLSSGTDYPGDNSVICLNRNSLEGLPAELVETYYSNVFRCFENCREFDIEQDLLNPDYMIRWNVNFNRACVEIIFPFTYPFEAPFVRVLSPKLKKTNNISDFGAILHPIVTRIGWNIDMSFKSFLLTIKGLVSSQETFIEKVTDNYYCEDGARRDFDLYVSELSFN